MASLDAQWLQITAHIEQIERDLAKQKPHSERRGELLRNLKAARTERMKVGNKITKRQKRKVAA